MMIHPTWFNVVLFAIMRMSSSLHMPSAVWPEDGDYRIRINHLLYLPEKDQLYIGGANNIYQLQGESLTLLNTAVDASNIVVLILNRTAAGEIFVTSCSSKRPDCAKRNASDVSVVEDFIKPGVPTDDCVMLAAIKTEADTGKKADYTFIACPHAGHEYERAKEDCVICPGLNWRKSDQEYFDTGRIKLKSSTDTNILTDKYIGSVVLEDFRIFFSIQRNKVTKRIQSRVAQICQKLTQTDKTYVDMVLNCGNYTILTDVEVFRIENQTIFVTSFFNQEERSSVVCIFTFAEIKSRLEDNIQDCYNGSRVMEMEDYISAGDRCQGGRGISKREENDYLCNLNKMQLYFSVVGTRSLDGRPVVIYNQIKLTAVAVTMSGPELVAFLGTDRGEIRKAVVYPVQNARKIEQWIVMVAYGEFIHPDMFIDRDKKNLFAMTSFKVVKIPVETCSDYKTCDDCYSIRDPHCGWCVAENRCTTSLSCNTTWAAAASRNNSCPQIKIWPKVLRLSPPGQNIQFMLSPPLPELQTVICRFHLDDENHSGTTPIVLGNTSATESENKSEEFICRTPDFTSVRNRIYGSAEVTVSILPQLSIRPIVKGKITIYDCTSFQSCASCKNDAWSCHWCSYDNKCVEDPESCNQDSENNLNKSPNLTGCPKILGVEEYSHVDENHTFYLPVHQDGLIILVKGQHLLEPSPELRYHCKIEGAARQLFDAQWNSSGQIECLFKKKYFQISTGSQISKLQVLWGNNTVKGVDIPVVVYNCTDLVLRVNNSVNCEKCKSFSMYEPYYQCKWCDNQCVYSKPGCRSETEICPAPYIKEVWPLRIHLGSPNVRLAIEGLNLAASFNETLESVTVGNQTCTSLENYFTPAERLSCLFEAPGEEGEATLTISLPYRQSVTYPKPIVFKNSSISNIFPMIGPASGGTLITIFGNDLDVGRSHIAAVGDKHCIVISDSITPKQLVCNTTASVTKTSQVSLKIDGFQVHAENSTFSYVDDPVITFIHPKKSFEGGGRRLTVNGTNLNAIQEPKVYARNAEDGRLTKSERCERDDENKLIYCPSPRYQAIPNNAKSRTRQKREVTRSREPWLIGFEMDGVTTVQDLRESLARIIYVENPTVNSFESTQEYNAAEVLIIKGNRMAVAASLSDIGVNIGQEKCNITNFTNGSIECHPPPDEPSFNKTSRQYPPIEVHIGYITYDVGELYYKPYRASPFDGSDRSKEYIIAGTMVGVLVLIVLVLVVLVIIITKRRRVTARENEKLMHQMENLEASVNKQCREEFAALQTTMSDLTSDLEGGNVLFRDFDVYATKILFMEASHPALTPPVIMSDSLLPGLDIFKGLLKNKEFLIMVIRTLEQQQTFTLQNRSNLASLIMAIHANNMEFVTNIMKTLLNDLVDKSVAGQREKLLLRRSECVVEKLVTNWLSVCLYHYLKERTGSALFILYKAIKVQVEKGPLDYITGCGKYTLSEAKLFTAGDAEINANSLALHVHHHDYITDQDHNITVLVLDCDSITQTKSKLLDVLYKNIPFSQRPNVHQTTLEIEETDGTKRMLHDEDASSEKDGIWKRLNTLHHYKVTDGTKAVLTINAEKDISMLSDTSSPDSFIVGSIKKSKQVMRTISGSHFWHLTKQHKSDEMKLSSEIFLPRLLNTKGTLQKYIDDLFNAMFHVDDDPPLVIKYFFDFLDGAAARHGITDPDVLHTWKCNSLLLRFWVNLIKNPEFVFDIHKPTIVDSCLSVITQTLMDSCSTAALRLGKDSPSNKLLFAKDIPRYTDMVRRFFQEIRDMSPISDQDLNVFLTENVSQNFGDRFCTTSAVLEVYNYVSHYKDEIMSELRSMEISADATPAHNHGTPLLMKLQEVYSSMSAGNSGTKLSL